MHIHQIETVHMYIIHVGANVYDKCCYCRHEMYRQYQEHGIFTATATDTQ